MPFVLDDTDVAIIRALENDARKSFRQVARETGISAPTVTERFDRLVNIGLIKSVSLVLDLDKIESSQAKTQPALFRPLASVYTKSKVAKGTRVALQCDYCHGPISGRPVTFRFAKYERYLCCTSCRDAYKEKYKARIASIVRKYSGDVGT